MMTNKEVIENFIRTDKAIYKLALMEAESEGIEEIPDSITVSGKSANGMLIKITISIKDGEYNE